MRCLVMSRICFFLPKIFLCLKPCAPNAVAITKSVVSDLIIYHFSKRAEKFAECMLGDETPEGLQAFIEKKHGTFKWKILN